jgi:hypothetical protein
VVVSRLASLAEDRSRMLASKHCAERNSSRPCGRSWLSWSGRSNRN